MDLPDGKYFYRTVIKSACRKAVKYSVAMSRTDWYNNIKDSYKQLDITECWDLGNDVIDCTIRLTPKNPITGWQLTPGAYGIIRASQM